MIEKTKEILLKKDLTTLVGTETMSASRVTCEANRRAKAQLSVHIFRSRLASPSAYELTYQSTQSSLHIHLPFIQTEVP